MSRLPVPGSDSGTWGDLLNDFLSQAHNTDGSLKSSAIPITSSDLGGPALIPIRFSAAVATTGVTATDRAYAARTLVGARMRVASAPSGSALSVDVQHFDGSTWTTIGSLSIASGSTVEVTTSFSQAQVVGNLVRLNVTSVGSTTAATGVAVDVLWS